MIPSLPLPISVRSLYPRQQPLKYLYPLHFSTFNTDELCNSHPKAITFDDYDENYGGKNIDIDETNQGPFCCRGGRSCGASSVTYTDPNAQSVICSGGFACIYATINANNATVYCEVSDSCASAQITQPSRVDCLTYKACSGVTITAASYIICAGRQGCTDGIIHSSG
eukprot:816813_1